MWVVGAVIIVQPLNEILTDLRIVRCPRVVIPVLRQLDVHGVVHGADAEFFHTDLSCHCAGDNPHLRNHNGAEGDLSVTSDHVDGLGHDGNSGAAASGQGARRC